MKFPVVPPPKRKAACLRFVQELLGMSVEEWEHLGRVFCRVEDALCVFYVGAVLIELEKMDTDLEVRVSPNFGSNKKWRIYSFKFGELAGFVLNGNDDKYTFVENLGNIFVFRQTDWNFMLRLLSKVELCHIVFTIGSIRIFITRPPCQEGVDLTVEFIDGRDSVYEQHYRQDDLANLTKLKAD
jgi:hypothetical protein